MRILQLTESLEVGGAERVVVTLANALAGQHQVSVVCLKQAGVLSQTLDPAVQLHCIGKREGTDIGAVWRLAGLIRSSRPDVVHTHDWGVYLDAMLASRLANVRANVHTVHGLYMAGRDTPWARAKRRLRHMLERRLARRTHLVCVSEELRRHVAAEVGVRFDATRAIANGVAVEPLAQPLQHVEAATVVFIAVCRLAAVKNLQLMLRAFARAREAMPAARLLIVGDGPERAALERLAATQRIEGSVRFLGFRTDTDALIRGADVLLLSSVSEGIPMSILEAMKNGRAVVATRVGGVGSLVEEGVTGLLVDPEDEAAFTAALQRLGTDRELRQAMGNAAHARAAALFGVDKMVASYVDLYGKPRR